MDYMKALSRIPVKVGTTTFHVKDEHVVEIFDAATRASKVPTPKAARAQALKGGVTRKYPKFKDGMTVAEYTRQYAMLNARTSGHGIQSGAFLSGEDVLREQGWIANFYEPLSTLPMFTPSPDEVVEETI